MSEALQWPLSLLSLWPHTIHSPEHSSLSSTDSDDSEYESATETELSISGKSSFPSIGILIVFNVHVLLQPGLAQVRLISHPGISPLMKADINSPSKSVNTGLHSAPPERKTLELCPQERQERRRSCCWRRWPSARRPAWSLLSRI